MRYIQSPLLLICLALSAAISVAYAATPASNTDGDSYYLYTNALTMTDAGVVAVPSRFKWSIETSWCGIDAQGTGLPDNRVMMRLYDPAHNFTALTAQMDLGTAENLQQQLADIIRKKRQNPNFQHRPQLYDPSIIPAGRITGVDDNGQATIEFETPKTK